MQSRYFKILIGLFGTFSLLLCISQFSQKAKVQNETVPERRNSSLWNVKEGESDLNLFLPKRNESEIDLILIWTMYFNYSFIHNEIENYEQFDYPGNESLYRPARCEQTYRNCRITDWRSLQDRADMIIFHWGDLNLMDVPHSRRADSIWTLYTRETEKHINQPAASVEMEMNATATFHSSSEIVIPYGWVYPLDQQFLDYRPDLSQKNLPIVWLVSHCKTSGKREIYVQRLRKHIQVDIWGWCHKHNHCSKRNFTQCHERLFTKYYFYLSFENSFCEEYATEKIFLALKQDIVPIVYGKADYEKILPPHSFIDASRMKPHDLADLVKSLIANRTAYEEYFRWKQSYFVEADRHENDHLICSACRYVDLWKRGLVQPKYRHRSIAQITDHWSAICDSDEEIAKHLIDD